MRSKRLLSIINNHWKTLIVILSLLIGGLSIYPIVHLLPIVTNIISNKLSTTIDSLEPDIVSHRIPQFEDQAIKIFLPHIQTPNQEPENPLVDNVLDTKLQEIDITPNGETITIYINMKEEISPSMAEVKISFLPGEKCSFGDGRACMYDYEMPNNTRVVLASVHSGRGGEGESFRAMVEGTGINHGLLTTDQVIKNIHSLIGSDILIRQGETEIIGLHLQAIVRIPSAYIETYLTLPIDQILAYAEEISDNNLEINSQDLFVLETCGWRLPDENHLSDYPNPMQSIYLGIFSFGY